VRRIVLMTLVSARDRHQTKTLAKLDPDAFMSLLYLHNVFNKIVFSRIVNDLSNEVVTILAKEDLDENNV